MCNFVYAVTDWHIAVQDAVPDAPPVRGIPYKQLSIGVPKETFSQERRVALVPATVQTLVKKGFTVNVEEGAGVEASFNNKEYEAAGAKVTNAANVFKSNIILKVISISFLSLFVAVYSCCQYSAVW